MASEAGRRKHIAYLQEVFRHWNGSDWGNSSDEEDATMLITSADEGASTPPRYKTPTRPSPPAPPKPESERGAVPAKELAGEIIASKLGQRWRERKAHMKRVAREAARIEKVLVKQGAKAQREGNAASAAALQGEREAAAELRAAMTAAADADRANRAKRIEELRALTRSIEERSKAMPTSSTSIRDILRAARDMVFGAPASPERRPKEAKPLSPAGGGLAAVRDKQRSRSVAPPRERLPLIEEPAAAPVVEPAAAPVAEPATEPVPTTAAASKTIPLAGYDGYFVSVQHGKVFKRENGKMRLAKDPRK